MNYAVLHTEKGSISSGGIGNHIDRKKGQEHTFKHADPQRLHLNHNFELPNNRHKMPLSEAIEDRIKEGYNGKRKIRTDAVKYTTHILTGTHGKMKEIFADQKKKNDWIKANFDFIKKEFGKDNIVRFTLHLDEKTPHIHAVTVPLTADGRLSAKEVIGNRNKMQKRQDRYAELMQPFGLHRGIKNTGIKHEDAKAYYKRINIENEHEIKPPRRILGMWEGAGVMKQTEELKTLKNAFKQNEIEKQRLKAKTEELHQELHREQNKNKRYYNNPQAFVQAVEQEKKEDKMLENYLFGVRITEHLLSHPNEINHEENAKNENYALNKMFSYHTEDFKFDTDFIYSNLALFKEIDREEGGTLTHNLERIRRESVRRMKDQEQRIKREQKQEEKQHRRRSRGRRM